MVSRFARFGHVALFVCLVTAMAFARHEPLPRKPRGPARCR
jgi:hypothetical protein